MPNGACSVRKVGVLGLKALGKEVEIQEQIMEA